MNKTRKILMRVAAENNTSVDEVRKEIAAAIDAGMNHPDPEIRKQWSAISRAGGTPAPEEVVAYFSRKI